MQASRSLANGIGLFIVGKINPLLIKHTHAYIHSLSHTLTVIVSLKQHTHTGFMVLMGGIGLFIVGQIKTSISS